MLHLTPLRFSSTNHLLIAYWVRGIKTYNCWYRNIDNIHWIIQFSCSVVFDSLRPHGLQHTRLPCPSPTAKVFSNSCPSSWWCHPTISSTVVPFSSCLQRPSIRVFSNESVLCIRWPKYWSFSFNTSPSNEYSELISFRMDLLDLLAVQVTLKSLLQYHSLKPSIHWMICH